MEILKVENMRGVRKEILIRGGLIVLAALLGIGALIYTSILAWICFVPAFFAARGLTPKQAAKYGALAGVIISAIPAVSLYRYGLGVVISISLYAACYGAIVVAAIGWIDQRAWSWRWLLFFPMVWVSLEFTRTLSPLSLPSNFAITQYLNLGFLQITTITGIYGVSFILVLANCVLYKILREPKVVFAAHSRKFTAMVAIAAIGILALLIIYPYGLMSTSSRPTKAGIKVAIVQGSIPIERYRAVNIDADSKEIINDIYFDLTEEAKTKHADLIVWPEGALADYAMQEPILKKKLQAIPRQARAFFLAGIPSKSESGIYNSVYVFSPSGEVVGQYDKINLVPYFEKYKPGRRSPVIKTQLAKLGIAICFESIYPRIVRRLAKEAEVLFILTNDAGFGNSKLVDFHAREAVFRAVENRRYIVRAAQSGISMFIDPMGRILGKTEEFERTILVGRVWPRSQTTFYTRHGDIFAYLCILGSATMFLSKKRRRKRNE